MSSPSDAPRTGSGSESALAILAGIGVGAIAIAIAVVVANRGNTTTKTTTAAWSAWSPGVSGGQGATAIADHIAPYYRFSVARQLDVVTPMALSNPSSNGTISGNGLVVAVNTGSARSEKLSLLGGHTVAYNICGLGTSNCALGGKPSSARLLLLRREALELALYSFKYINGTQNVIAMLPPGRTDHERPIQLRARLQGEQRRKDEQAARSRRPVRQARVAAVADHAPEEDARSAPARRSRAAALDPQQRGGARGSGHRPRPVRLVDRIPERHQAPGAAVYSTPVGSTNSAGCLASPAATAVSWLGPPAISS